MKFQNIGHFMGRQIEALKELEALIAHSEKDSTHAVAQSDVEVLKDYVTTMKTACVTANTLAKYYIEKEKPEVKTTAETEGSESEEEQKPTKTKRTTNKKDVQKVKEQVETSEEDFDFLN